MKEPLTAEQAIAADAFGKRVLVAIFQAIQTLVRRIAPLPTGPIYHYTNASVPSLILDGCQLRFTHFADLNDTSEVQHFWDLARQDYAPRIERGSFLLSQTGDRPLNEDDIADIVVSRSVGAEDPFPREPYVMSFSDLDDDVQQWRSYACNGQGVCMYFDPGEVASLLSRRFGQGSAPSVLLPVIYEDAHKLELARTMVEATCRNLADAMNGTDDKRLVGEFFAIGIGQLYVMMSLCAPMCKHRGFRSEREWRAVLLGSSKSRSRAHEEYAPSGGVRFFADKRRFADIGIPRGLVRGIQPGPHCDVSALQESLDRLFGWSISEELLLPRSTVPMRHH